MILQSVTANANRPAALLTEIPIPPVTQATNQSGFQYCGPACAYMLIRSIDPAALSANDQECQIELADRIMARNLAGEGRRTAAEQSPWYSDPEGMVNTINCVVGSQQRFVLWERPCQLGDAGSIEAARGALLGVARESFRRDLPIIVPIRAGEHYIVVSGFGFGEDGQVEAVSFRDPGYRPSFVPSPGVTREQFLKDAIENDFPADGWQDAAGFWEAVTPCAVGDRWRDKIVAIVPQIPEEEIPASPIRRRPIPGKEPERRLQISKALQAALSSVEKFQVFDELVKCFRQGTLLASLNVWGSSLAGPQYYLYWAEHGTVSATMAIGTDGEVLETSQGVNLADMLYEIRSDADARNALKSDPVLVASVDIDKLVYPGQLVYRPRSDCFHQRLRPYYPLRDKNGTTYYVNTAGRFDHMPAGQIAAAATS